jgi:3-hydroxyisobutyrate dehydrogenase-like beta-hydroxyacid dehydrogenase
METDTVAVLGLGIIGSIWAGHYASDGVLAASWNRSPKPELDLKQTDLAGCAGAAGVLQLCLYDADSVRGVLEQLCPHLNAQHLLIQSSTIDGASADEFAAKVRETGARYLEAPFTGSRPAAEQRKTVFYLGGEAAVAAEAEPLLQRISTKRFHIGAPAQATAIKLAMNLQIAGISQALCEAITLAREAGVGDDMFFEVMRANVAWSGLADLKEPKLRAHDFSPQFSVKNLHKDMRLAQKTAGRPLPVLERIVDCLAAAEDRGYGEEDFIALIRMLREPAQ